MTEKLFAWKEDVDASAAIAAQAAAEAAQAAAEAALADAEALLDDVDFSVPSGDRMFGYDAGDAKFKAFEASDFTALSSIGGTEDVLAYNATGDLVKIDMSVFPTVAPSYLINLLDVDISSPQDGQALTYDSGSSTWVNATPATTLDSLTDVTITTPSSGQALTYNGSIWINSTPVQTFLGLTDTPSSYSGQALKLARVNAGETAIEFFTGAFTASAISFTPAGTIAATDVQSAIAELDSEMDERIADVAGAMVTGNTETLITVTYQDSDNTIDFVVNNDLSAYDNSTSAFLTATTADALFLTPAEGNAAYQPLDSDLTSWAGVTRASGFDTFVATPSAANFASLVTDDAFSLADAELGALAGLTSAADKLPYFTGSGTAALADLSSAMRTFLTTSSSANWASVLTDDAFSMSDAELGAIAGLVSAADKFPYFTGSGTAALADLSSAMRTFMTTPSMANLGSLLSDDASGWTTFGTTPSSANLRTLVTDETGTGALVFADAPQMSTIELGHATDTTLARTAAGRVTIESVPINRYTYQASAPSSPLEGDKWVDSDDLTEYTYVNDGDSSQWVSLSSPAGASYWGSFTSVVGGSISYTSDGTAYGGPFAISTSAGAFGPMFNTFHNSASPAASDQIGGLFCYGRDSAANVENYGYFFNFITDPTSTSEDSAWVLGSKNAGTMSDMYFYPGGIRFPATQITSSDANQLDDYEEGSWTPTFIAGGSSASVTYSNQIGQYTKIGRAVQYGGRLTLTNNGTGTGTAQMGGFPFTCASTIFFSGSGTVNAGGSSALGLTHYQDQSNTTATFTVPAAAGAASATDTNCTNSFDYLFAGVYNT